MSISVRWFIGLMIPVLALSGMGYFNSCIDWLAQPPSLAENIDEDQERLRGDQLNDQLAQTTLRRNAKARIVHDLKEGQLSLREAAVWFGYLQAQCGYSEQFRRTYPGRTLGERLCRQVLNSVEREAAIVEDSQVRATLHRLRGEFNEMHACDAFGDIARD